MDLAHEFNYIADLAPPQVVGAGPFGTRMFIAVTGGSVTGERINGTVSTGGGDWLLAGADGFSRLDVRVQIVTDDGAVIYLSYNGLLEMNEAIQGVLAGGETGTDYGDQYFRTTPRLETGDERYAWVNQTVFVAEGRALPGPKVEYRVSRVT